MTPAEISIAQAKQNKLFYFAVNALVFRESDSRVLLLKRSSREKVHPGKYATPGGKLEWEDLNLAHPTRMNGDVPNFEDAVEKLLVREVREEAGIEVKGPLHYINSVVFIRPDNIPVVLIKFAVRYKSGEIALEDAFTDYAWVNAEEVKQYDCVEGITEEVVRTIVMFQHA